MSTGCWIKTAGGDVGDAAVDQRGGIEQHRAWAADLLGELDIRDHQPELVLGLQHGGHAQVRQADAQQHLERGDDVQLQHDGVGVQVPGGDDQVDHRADGPRRQQPRHQPEHHAGHDLNLLAGREDVHRQEHHRQQQGDHDGQPPRDGQAHAQVAARGGPHPDDIQHGQQDQQHHEDDADDLNDRCHIAGLAFRLGHGRPRKFGISLDRPGVVYGRGAA
jgi:hypothetical protein